MHSGEPQYVTGSWAECLGLAGRELVSLVGAGGKTSLMEALGRELAWAGQRVVMTTTTRIFRPGQPVIIEPDPPALIDRLSRELLPGEAVTVAAGEESAGGQTKLVGLTPETVDDLWQARAAEFVVVEADGSRRLPVKAPRPGEPVLPGRTTVLVGIIGLSALGRPLAEDHALAADRLAGITGTLPGAEITPHTLARLIAHPEGLFKSAPAGAWPVLFLNQADLPEAREAGLETLRQLAPLRSGLRAVLGSIREGFREVYELAD